MSDLHPTAAQGYGQGANIYARGRPDFPPQALEWLRQDLGIGPGSITLELGAGTGKFTRLLAKTGTDVIAVEPVAAMLAQLSAEMPGIRALRASAQSLPLADASVDCAICAQSFHWFATAAAVAEIRRVLRPGGALGLIWNVRVQSVSWVSELTRLIDRHEGDAPRYDDGEWRKEFPAPGFGVMRERSLPHLHTGSAEQVIVDRMASVSFIAALPETEKRVLLDQVRALIDRTPELAGQSAVSMPYETRMYWCRAV
ncbi:MAG TPA: methyltransferase domain-containing protein [Steroidobacteraceae bacterium]|nr:methyltransferase domain-containing protein [Steroidobacteraceae bacterium]